MTSPTQLLARYQHLRQLGMALNNTLVSRLGKDVVEEGGELLGILRRGALVLGSESEMAVLMDFCIHDVRRHGLNAVEHFLTEEPYPPGSDERLILEALKDARFSLFLVERQEPGVGVQVRDIVKDLSLRVVDVSFSRSAEPDMLLAFRLFAPEGIPMTTGAPIPVGVVPGRDREDGLDALASLLRGAWTPEQRSEATANIIRALLQEGATSHVAYASPGGGAMPQPSKAPKPPPGVGKYDPCPCGSGKKFKFCCGARR